MVVFMNGVGFAAADHNAMADNALDGLPGLVSSISGGRTVAILDFQYDAKVEVKNVEEKAALQLSKTGKFVIVDRKTLEVLLKEQSMSMSGLTDSKKSLEIGKIIGVDTFLSGKVTSSRNTLVINLQMKDVKTSGIVWMGELVGKDVSRGRFAAGARVSSFLASARTILKDNAGAAIAADTAQSKQPVLGAAFQFHYIRQSALSRRLLFGVDATFTRGDWTRDPFDGTAGGNTYSVREKISDYNMTLMPILKFKVLPKSEIFMLYAGAGLSADYVGLDATYTLNGTTVKHSKIKLYPAGGIAFKAGAESMVSDNVSFFFESTRMPLTVIKRDVTANFRSELTLEEGSYNGFGVRYFFGQ
jgi:TolB-like protein